MAFRSPETVQWSARQWGVLLGGLFLAQAGLVCFLGTRGGNPPAAPAFATEIHWSVGPGDAKHVFDWPGFQEPALFALPHLEGFSGSAWLRFPLFKYELTDWTEPPVWLKPRPEWLAETFLQAAATNVFPPLRISDKPMPPLIGSEPRVTLEPAMQASKLRVSGGLSGRQLLAVPTLPAWPHTVMLSNTVVHAMVDATGFVLSATMLESCGLKTADDFALKAALEIRFGAPAEGASRSSLADAPACGWLVFQWHTLPPAPSAAIREPPADRRAPVEAATLPPGSRQGREVEPETQLASKP